MIRIIRIKGNKGIAVAACHTKELAEEVITSLIFLEKLRESNPHPSWAETFREDVRKLSLAEVIDKYAKEKFFLIEGEEVTSLA